jgi:hypothetical protein
LNIQNFRDNLKDNNFNSNNLPSNLDIDLQNDGYDIIYVDYNEGGGDIVKNAWLVREVIQWVNAEKAKNNSTEKNIVLGQSMGGLVARYALRKMEQLNENHQTSHYISFDSPHLGANMPLGYQQMLSQLNYFVDLMPASQAKQIKDAWTAIRSIATKQMLLYYIDDNNYNYFTPAPDAAYTNLQTELQNMGLPVNCKTIAVANGNSDGLDQGFQPEELLLQINKGGQVKLDIKVWALADNYTAAYKPIYHGDIGIELYLFTYHFVRDQSVNFTRPYDSAPGGFYDLSVLGLNGSRLPFPTTKLVNTFGFVPTVSSLSIFSELNNPYYSFGTSNITPTGLNKTPFQKTAVFQYYASSSNNNDPHISFTYGNDGLLRNEAFFPNLSSTIAQPITSLNATTYTFGVSATNRTVNRIKRGYNIYNNSNLNVNTNNPIGYSNSGLAINNSEFTLEVVSCLGLINTINVENGSKITVGDGINRKGNLVFRPNTQLTLQAGAQLIISEGSNIVFDDGAFLTYSKGSIIKLLGSNSVLIAKAGGKIQIGKDAIFNYTGDGFIRFETASPNSAAIEAIGTNAQFKLVGGSFGSTAKKVMEVVGGHMLSTVPTYGANAGLYDLRLFSIQNGNVVMDANSCIHVEGIYTQADFRSLDVRAAVPNSVNNRHRGIVVNGQLGNSFYKFTVTDAKTGINSRNIYGGNDVDLIQVTASRCETGIYVNGAGARIQDYSINNCTTGIKLVGMTRSTRLYNGDVFYNTIGVEGSDCINNVIELYQPKIYNNFYGVKAINTTFASLCGLIKNNLSSVPNSAGKYDGANVYLVNNGNFILDPIMRAGAGRTDLGNNRSVAIRQASASYGPYINQAGSSLLTSMDYSITGTLAPIRTSLPRVFYNTPIFANGNLWNTSGGSPVFNIDYLTKYSNGGAASINMNYRDNSPIPFSLKCNATGGGGAGTGTERMRGFINGTVTPIADLNDKMLQDGSMLKAKIQEGYSYFYDLSPNYDLAIRNLLDALNANFTPEELTEWSIAITEINAQLIEALSESIYERDMPINNDPNQYSEMVQRTIDLQDKLLNDFASDNQQQFKVYMAKAALYRMLGNLELSNQILNTVDRNLYPEMNDALESFNCLVNKELLLVSGAVTTQEYESLPPCPTTEDLSVLPPPFMDSPEELEKILNGDDQKTNNLKFALSVYPNPSKGVFNLTFNGQEASNYTIEIVDILGKKVYTSAGIVLLNNNIEINLANLNTGTYFIKVVNGSNAETKKVMIVK